MLAMFYIRIISMMVERYFYRTNGVGAMFVEHFNEIMLFCDQT